MCLLLVLGAASAPAAATGSAEWAEHQRTVAAACKDASALAQPAPAGPPIEFDDRVGITALLVDGRYRQPHIHRRRGRELCLFDRRNGTAYVAPADLVAAKVAK